MPKDDLGGVFKFLLSSIPTEQHDACSFTQSRILCNTKTILISILTKRFNAQIVVASTQMGVADSMSYADQQDDESLSDDDYVVGTFGSDSE